MKQYCAYFLIIGFSITSIAQTNFEFSDLDYLSLLHNSVKIGVPKVNFKHTYKPCSEFNNCPYKDDESMLFIGEYTLDNNTTLYLFFSNGSSQDPQIYVTQHNQIVANVMGNTFHFKGHTMYVEGTSNNCFNRKRKFKFDGETYKEVQQPLSYVGVKGHLNTALNIYQSKDLKVPVAYLPEQYLIEIVAVDFNHNLETITHLLIKTEFGLLGWIAFNIKYFDGGLIDNFKYLGD